MGECLIIRGGGGTDTSNATATASVVLSGYTCYVDDRLIAGSMPVQTLNQKLGAGGSVTIPAGYYDGSSSVISTSTLAEETAANAASSHILSGYNGWVNGGLVQGSMANWGNTGATLAANGVYWIPAGWHAGAGVVNQSLAVHWGGTYTPNTGNQVMCWAGWYTGGNIVVLGSGNLTAGNIKHGVKIFGVTGTFSSWVDWRSQNVIWPSSSGNKPNTKSPVYIDYVVASGQLAGDVWISHMQPYVWGWGCVKFLFSNPSSTSYAITCFNSSGGQISKISGSMTRNATIAIQWEFSAMGISSQNLNMILFHVNNLMAVDTLTMWYTLNYGTGTGGATTV